MRLSDISTGYSNEKLADDLKERKIWAVKELRGEGGHMEVGKRREVSKGSVEKECA